MASGIGAADQVNTDSFLTIRNHAMSYLLQRVSYVIALCVTISSIMYASEPGTPAPRQHPSGLSPSERVFVVPRILEKSGTTNSTQYTFDHAIYLNYLGGQAGIPDGNGATVEFYYYDQATNLPMQGGLGTDLCNPCLYQLDSINRKVSIRMDDLIMAGGGFTATVKLGYGIIIVHGPDSMAVSGQSIIANSHTSAFDLSMTGSNLIPRQAGSSSRTYVIPHFTEKLGTINATQYTYDSELMMLFTGGLGPLVNEGGDTVQVWLYDNTGAVLTGTGGDVCNPCRYELNSTNPRQTLRFDDAMSAKGAFDISTVRLGFAVVSVTGPNADAVSLENFLLNSHTSPFDLSMLNATMPELTDGASDRYIAIPHFGEKAGSINTTQNTIDNSIYATYVPGLPGARSDGGGANLDLYLYGAYGDPLLTQEGTEVCNPCSFPLDNSSRKLSRKIDDLILAKGTFPASVLTGFGLIHISGSDPSGVSVSGIEVNSHTSPYDVGLYQLPMSEHPVAASGSIRAYILPHVLEKAGMISNTQFTFDHSLMATYSGGLGGSSSGSGATLSLFLYNSSGTAMTNNGLEVCSPCTYSLDAVNNRKVNVRIDDRILANGGFDQTVKLGYGVVTVSGDVNNVILSSFIVNSHTSAFDIEAFGYTPPELALQAPTFDVRSGWNLLSVPRIARDMHKTSIFPAATSNAFAYSSGYFVQDSLAIGLGYWLKYADAGHIEFSGLAVSQETTQVQMGWNLIGSISAQINTTSILSDPPRIITSQFFGYSGQYAPSGLIMPGRAYWVKTSQSGLLILSSAGNNPSTNRIRIIPTVDAPPLPPGEGHSSADASIPNRFELEQNYPNPFNPTTLIRIALPERSYVRVTVYNVLGQQVFRLINAERNAGYTDVPVDAGGMASGLYFYHLDATSVADPAKHFSVTKRMLLLK